MIGDSTSEESMVQETSCAACHAQISVYAAMTGLLPEEHINGRRATHSWLVCKLRQELNALHDELAAIATRTEHNHAD